MAEERINAIGKIKLPHMGNVGPRFLGRSRGIVRLGKLRHLASLGLGGRFFGRSLFHSRSLFRGFGNGRFFPGFSLGGSLFRNRLLGRNVGGIGRSLSLGDVFGLGRNLGGRLLGGRSSRLGFLRRALLDPLPGLLARLGLLRVVARRSLADAGGIEEA